jgi:hypothetical protein
MGLAFGYPQAGTCSNIKRANIPDITIQSTADPRKIRVVGEVKTPWITKLSAMDPEQLTQLFGKNTKLNTFMYIRLTYYTGQPARYTDDYGTSVPDRIRGNHFHHAYWASGFL